MGKQQKCMYLCEERLSIYVSSLRTSFRRMFWWSGSYSEAPTPLVTSTYSYQPTSPPWQSPCDHLSSREPEALHLSWSWKILLYFPWASSDLLCPIHRCLISKNHPAVIAWILGNHICHCFTLSQNEGFQWKAWASCGHHHKPWLASLWLLVRSW